MDQFSPLPIFVDKVLLEHILAHSFTQCLWLLAQDSSRAEWWQQRPYVQCSQNWIYLLYGFLQEKFPLHCSMDRPKLKDILCSTWAVPLKIVLQNSDSLGSSEKCLTWLKESGWRSCELKQRLLSVRTSRPARSQRYKTQEGLVQRTHPTKEGHEKGQPLHVNPPHQQHQSQAAQHTTRFHTWPVYTGNVALPNWDVTEVQNTH